MIDFTLVTNNNSSLLYLAMLLWLLLMIEAFSRLPTIQWGIPALMVYFTTGFWYFVEPFYLPEHLANFSADIVDTNYLQIILFLLCFRFFVPKFAKAFTRQVVVTQNQIATYPEILLKYAFFIWLILLAIGIYRMNGNVMAALFPSSRWVTMWSRAAIGGSTSFLVSVGDFTYGLICAFFGVLLPMQKKKSARLFNLILLAIALPYFFLPGTRSQFLAVILPGYLNFLIFSPRSRRSKILITVAGFFCVNFLMTLMIAYRNEGVINYFSLSTQEKERVTSDQKHEGLDMLQELSYINYFVSSGRKEIDYGWRYFTELTNIIPRAIWPNKPLLGIDYAVLRGFGGTNGQWVATLSYGFIGQGVLDFGRYLGPLAPGLLLALWTGLITRLFMQAQAGSILRQCLFLVGLGLTFNLGRGISFLVLYPMIFGYILVRVLENTGTQNKYPRQPQQAYTKTPPPRPRTMQNRRGHSGYR